MSVTVRHDVDLETCQCASCGIIWGLPVRYEQLRRDDHKGFYCPNGHSQWFPHKSEAEELREQLKAEQAKLANAQFELMAVEKKLKRTEKRIKNGVCPCCHRQFVQLTRHMKTKHPEFAR